MKKVRKRNSAGEYANQRSLTLVIAFLTLMIGSSFFVPHLIVRGQRVTVDALQPMALTVVAPDGTQVILNEDDIASLSSYRAFGGFVKSNGVLSNLGYYTGVPITAFVSMIGGISSGYSVKVVASDNFSKTLNYIALNMFNDTGLVTYDNVTGQVVQHNQTLTPMLAYFCNDTNLPSGDGPLRFAIVGSEGLLTQSSLWVKNIVRLELQVTLAPMNLALVALNGTQLTLNETAISKLPANREVGASRNKMGIVKGLGNYTGPSLNTFCSLVGGMNSSNSLRITAADNYSQTFSYEQVNGAFQTYDITTGQLVQHNQSLTPIIAYFMNDADILSSDGPLRVAIVGPEGLATDSSLWIKKVVKLEIRLIDDVAITEIAPEKTIVGKGYSCKIDATAENHGGYTENFNVTLRVNGTIIGIQNVILESSKSLTVEFIWNTTEFKGNYSLSASATTVPDETNTANNNLARGWVFVGIIGDTNADRSVNINDVYNVAKAYGSEPENPKWDPNCDINGDLKIDIKDYYIICRHFGTTDS